MPEPTLNTVTITKEWKAMVEEHEDLSAPHDAYEFSSKTFKETDESGVYES